MYTLFIDTHNELIKIILFKDGKIITNLEKESKMQHSVYTMPMIEETLTKHNLVPSDINEIIVVNGPGSFTGVRIGVTIAKTMAYLLNIPIKAIDTLKMQAMLIDKNKKIVIEEEKNGKFVGLFDKNNQTLEEYKYLKKDEFEKFCENNTIDKINIDYEKLYECLKLENPVNPHSVNPLYIKKIEVGK